MEEGLLKRPCVFRGAKTKSRGGFQCSFYYFSGKKLYFILFFRVGYFIFAVAGSETVFGEVFVFHIGRDSVRLSRSSWSIFPSKTPSRC